MGKGEQRPVVAGATWALDPNTDCDLAKVLAQVDGLKTARSQNRSEYMG